MSDSYNDFNAENTEQTAQQTAEVVSEPYRYRYQNGEKSEDIRYNHYYYGTSGSNYNTSSDETQNTASSASPKKKRPFLKKLSKHECP